MNITELARRLKITPKELKNALPALGFHIGQRAIQIPDKQAEKVMEAWQSYQAKQEALKKIQEKTEKLQLNQDQQEEKKDKKIIISSKIRVHDLAEKLQIPLNKVMKALIQNGVFASVNENLDYEVAAIIIEELGFQSQLGEDEEKESEILVKEKLKQILDKEKDNNQKFNQRPPVVVVMGHVDHGKTTILDAIRETQVAAKEEGGITQKIGAYQVKKDNHLITFIDTPGHEAFQSMRSRGGEVADLAILVIAADDQIQPQTLESIRIIQQAEIPFVIALNKTDKPEADLNRLKKELSEINLSTEDWGGKVISIPVSAKTKDGIDQLLEMVLLVAEIEKGKLKTNPQGEVIGTIIETHLDEGCGPIAALITYNGTLKKGDNVIIGHSYGRLRLIKDEHGKEVKSVPAGMPVQVFGLKGVPQAGDIITVIKDNKEFKKIIKGKSFSYQKKVAIDHNRNINSQAGDGEEVKSLNLILRADVLGSLEAIVQALDKLNHPEVRINILKKGLGNLTETDVELSRTTQAWIIGFNVEATATARQLASESETKILIYQIIYDLIEEIKKEMNSLLTDEIIEKKIGEIEVLAFFKKTTDGQIIGGRVKDGKIINESLVRIWDKEHEIKGEGRLKNLQLNKQDVAEAKAPSECGMKIVTKTLIEIGDILEVCQEIKKQRTID